MPETMRHCWDPSDFVGGAHCLDFANTVQAWDGDEAVGDRLGDYADLLAWTRASGDLDAAAADALQRAAAAAPGAASAIVDEARRLRGALHRTICAIAAGETIPEAELAVLNEWIAQAHAVRRLTTARGGLDWGWADATGLARPLWPIALSAADLLRSADPKRLRQCGGETCHWLFYDTSKSGRRRWCDMSVCGNRAKARRHYRRRHGSAANAAKA